MAELGELLGGLLSDPELLRRAAGALTAPPSKEAPLGEAKPPYVSSPPQSGRARLLMGAKPYLKPQTCQRLDAALLVLSALEGLTGSKKGDD